MIVCGQGHTFINDHQNKNTYHLILWCESNNKISQLK